MITVPQATETIIKRSRYLTEALSKGIINISALARYIKPEVESMLLKRVNQSSITMAINRLKAHLKPHVNYKNLFNTAPEMALRSNLSLLSFPNSEDLYEKCSKFFQLKPIQRKHFFTLTEGLSETTIIISNTLKHNFKLFLDKTKSLSDIDKLSSVTIQLPGKATFTPGVFYFFMKSLVWEGLNIVEIVSTNSEVTLVFNDSDANKAFSVLKSLFS